MPVETIPQIITEEVASSEVDQEHLESVDSTKIYQLLGTQINVVMKDAERRYALPSAEYSSTNLKALSVDDFSEFMARLPAVFRASESFLFNKPELTNQDKFYAQVIQSAIIGTISEIQLGRVRMACAELEQVSDDNLVSLEDYKNTKARLYDQKVASRENTILANHTFRELAHTYDVPREGIKEIIAASLPNDLKSKAVPLEKGVAAEVAVLRQVEHIVSELEEQADGKKRIIRGGDATEDWNSGDLVYIYEGKTFYIDVKASNGLGYESETRNYIFTEPELATSKQDAYYANVKFKLLKPEVIDENYKVRDPRLSIKLEKMLEALEALA